MNLNLFKNNFKSITNNNNIYNKNFNEIFNNKHNTRILSNNLNNNKINSNNLNNNKINSNNIEIIYILTSNYTHTFVKNLNNYILNIGIKCKILVNYINDNIINYINNNNSFICIINIQELNTIMQKYKINNFVKKNKIYIFQTEQLNQNKRLSIRAIYNSNTIFEYSNVNLTYYDNKEKNINKIIKVLPLINNNNFINIYNNPTFDKYINYKNKDIDILFYGTINIRRDNILKHIINYCKINNYNIKIVDKTFGEELHNLLTRSKIILNIHYYNNSILEIFRIHEVLEYDCNIISEDCNSNTDTYLYNNIVKFFPNLDADLNGLNKLFNLIKQYTNTPIDIDFRYNFITNINNKNKLILNKKILYKNYEYLFHKYNLNISNPGEKIKYNIISNNLTPEFKVGKYYAHLHCYDISRFTEIYGDYIDTINRYFYIIITHSIGSINIENSNSYVILKIPNKGLDIGAKFCAVAYLNSNKIYYEYILFLHSKSNPETRKKYFNPIVDNLSREFIENINGNDSYFPDIEWEIVGDRLKWVSVNPDFLDHENTNPPERNLLYRDELLKYLGGNKTNHFIEGNCYILSKQVIDKLYTDPLLYNILNTATSFDYNWVCKAYNTRGDIYQVYRQFLEGKLAPRNKNSYDDYFEHVFERVVLNFCSNYKILNNELITKISNKNDFRNLCKLNLSLINNIIIPDIEFNKPNETFYIEFRKFTHCEFIIRNIIIKLPDWSHTIICGNLNYEFMKKIADSISSNIKIVKLDIDNLNTAEYSQLLMSKEFWDNFNGEKLLLYQEDSYMFHNRIDEFLEYDYIGAPWPIDQDEHVNQKEYGVGNGGFSLRSKSKMIEVIEKINWEKDLILGENLKQYMVHTNNYIIPEDVYFSKSLLEKGIGKVAPRYVALKFSQETQKSLNPLGGHNFYLANNYKLFGLVKINKKIGIFTHIPYTLGGGELYISKIIEFFTNLNYQIFYYNNTHPTIFNETKKIYIDEKYHDLVFQKNMQDIKFIKKYEFDYFIEMSNSKAPTYINHEFAYKNIFHSQFPYDYKSGWNIPNINFLDCIIVNSEFTDTYYKQCSYNRLDSNKIKILYPLCFENLNNTLIKKIENTFIMIGRIFRHSPGENNKNHKYVIDLFKKFSNNLYTLYIIGSCKDQEYLNFLKESIKTTNIHILHDIDENKKNSLLSECKYFIHATGADNEFGKFPSSEEHFGISIIEGMNYGCLPICANRGFPPFYIKDKENGLLFDNFNELYLLIQDLIVNKKILYKNNFIEINNKIIDKFNKKNYISNLSNILLNI